MSLIVKDGISPRLAHMARNIADKRPVLEAMALAMRLPLPRGMNDKRLWKL